MTPNTYLLGSSYFARPGDGLDWFHARWVENTLNYSRPQKVIVLATGEWPRLTSPHVQYLRLSGNLGHCDDLLNGVASHFMPGGPAAWMALAWLAYMNETDLIVKEQDCLAFGPWVEKMYSEIGRRSLICGWNRMQGAAMSLFLVKHSFIPQFIQDYLVEGTENVISRICETKMVRLINRKPEDYGYFTFGCDKDRPFNVADPVWYAQKFTPVEMLQLKSFGLITSCDGMPDVAAFTNTIP